jgi:hypothetical protein
MNNIPNDRDLLRYYWITSLLSITIALPGMIHVGIYANINM